MRHERKRLIRDVWPDKRLFACVLLFVAGLLGVLYAWLLTVAPIRFGPAIPRVLLSNAASLTMALSLLVVIFAWLALRSRSTSWAFAAVACGVLSLGFLGIESLLALVASGFLVATRLDGADASQDAPEIHPHTWPDKSLAASMLLFVGAFASAGWAFVLLGGLWPLQGVVPLAMGGAAVLVAALDLVRRLPPLPPALAPRRAPRLHRDAPHRPVLRRGSARRHRGPRPAAPCSRRARVRRVAVVGVDERFAPKRQEEVPRAAEQLRFAHLETSREPANSLVLVEERRHAVHSCAPLG